MTPLSPTALEAAAKHIYEDKGDRKGIVYVGWDAEPESVKSQWREDVSAAITAYLAQAGKEGWVMVPVEPTGNAKNAISTFVRSRAIPSPSDNDPDDVYFDAGHARELYAIVLAAAQNGGE